VNGSRVYDNDCSFLSGWGLALWRSSGNLISRNAFDFCVRGHSEGVYNRGQDSAGILFFEQCSSNVVIENSATHGGDGFFGFAGLEALGLPDTKAPGLDYRKVGCNDNVFLRNDFSYSPAHGVEMTFSFGNVIAQNRFVDNAITGVWGGFSQDTLIVDNFFDGNGGMAYGLERGGVNIEHSINNFIVDNTFINNRVGIALWWDHPGDVNRWAWGVNYGPLRGNVIAGNAFVINDEARPFFRVGEDEPRIGIRLRDDSGRGELSGTVLSENAFELAGERAVAERIDEVIGTSAGPAEAPTVAYDRYEAIGDTRPITMADGVPFSARSELRGRHMILVDEWGPWDHTGTFVRAVRQGVDERAFEVFGVPGELEAKTLRGEPAVTIEPSGALPGAKLVTIRGEPGVTTYRVGLSSADGGFEREVSGTLIRTRWQVRFFPWTESSDPREDLDAWMRRARSSEAVGGVVDELRFPYGNGGPADQPNLPAAIREAGLPSDRFGMIAQARVPLPAGTWRVTTTSDDGVRVLVDDDPVIDNWTWHPTQTDVGTFTVDRPRSVVVRVMHFEIDGGATFSFDLERAE
jgi:hypothetical protein